MTNNKLVRVYVAGGFLGAGKTTALIALADRFSAQGLRTALITNDHTAGLVDSEIVRAKGIRYREISGSCICCRFKDFLDAADTLWQEFQPDILLTEPIGTSADLTATVLRPLQVYTQDRYRVMPLSVLADPERVIDLLEPIPSPLENERSLENIRYLFNQQLDETDIMLLTKADITDNDTMERARQLLLNRYSANKPSLRIQPISAVTGEGLDEWLKTLDSPFEYIPDDSIRPNDNRHTEAEAVLGWLNLESIIVSQASWEIDLMAFVRGFFTRLIDRLEGTFIGHLKLFAESKACTLKANLTDWRSKVQVEALKPSSRPNWPANNGARIVINLRAAQTPDFLYRHTVQTLEEIASLQQAESRIIRQEILRPNRPTPTFHITLPD